MVFRYLTAASCLDVLRSCFACLCRRDNGPDEDDFPLPEDIGHFPTSWDIACHPEGTTYDGPMMLLPEKQHDYDANVVGPPPPYSSM